MGRWLLKGADTLDGPIIRSAKSVGAALRTKYLLRKVDLDTSDLTEGQQRRLGAFLRRSGRSGAGALDEMDERRLRKLVSPSLDEDELERLGGIVSRSDLSAPQLARKLDAFESLDRKKKALRFLEASGDDGLRAIDRLVDSDVDAETVLRRLDRVDDAAKDGVARALSDGVDPARVSRSLRRYDELDTDANRQQFEGLLAHSDPKVRNSWIKTTGDKIIDSEAVAEGINLQNDISSDGHKLTSFKTGEQVNEAGNFEDPPHREDSIVVNFETTETTLYRVYGRNREPPGPWFMGAKSIAGLSEKQIIDKFALLEKKWGVDYHYVAKWDVPEGKRMRYSIAGPLTDRDGDTLTGGGKQYYVRGRVDEDQLTKMGTIEETTDDIDSDDG